MKETFFISHGSPVLLLDHTLPARHFMLQFQEKVFPQKPKAILIISAHWETSEPTVNVINGCNPTIHDFTNFPSNMYQLTYPAPGAAELALKVKQLLKASGFPCVHEDENRGLDHGAWIPLMLMYPEGDIPVCQLSVQTERDGTHHYNVGRALSSLKDEGVLIIGSGFATHNIKLLKECRKSGNNVVEPLSIEFDNWLKEVLLTGRYEDVNHFEEKAPNAKIAHPEPEHFYPLHVAIGAAGQKSKAELVHHSWTHCLSYASYKFVSMD